MSLTIHWTHAYAFLGGLFIGKFTNMFSDVVITGLVLYIVTPEVYTVERADRVKNYFKRWFGNKQIVIQHGLPSDDNKMITNTPASNSLLDLSSLPKIEILASAPTN